MPYYPQITGPRPPPPSGAGAQPYGAVQASGSFGRGAGAPPPPGGAGAASRWGGSQYQANAFGGGGAPPPPGGKSGIASNWGAPQGQAGAFGGSAPPPPGAAKSATDRFGSLFGNSSAQQVLAAQSANPGVGAPVMTSMSGVPPAPGSAPSPPVATKTPQEASLMQSAAPGLQNGNEANGYADPLGSAVASSQPLPNGAPQAAPIAPQMPAPVVAAMKSAAAPPAPAPPQETAPKMAALSAGKAAEGLPPETPWQDPFDDRGWKEQFGQSKPANWDNWSQKQRQAWKAKNFQGLTKVGAGPTDQDAPVTAPPPPPAGSQAPIGPEIGTLPSGAQASGDGYIGPGGNLVRWDSTDSSWKNFLRAGGKTDEYIANSPNWNEGFWQNAIGMSEKMAGKVSALPPPGSYMYDGEQVFAGIEIPTNFLDDRGDNYIKDPGVRDLVKKAYEWSGDIDSIERSPDKQEDVKKLELLWRKMNTAMSALEQYGISFDPENPKSGGAGAGSSANQFIEDRLELPNTDLGGQLPSFSDTTQWKDVVRLFNPRNAEEAAAAAQFAGDLEERQYGRDLQQKGVNVYSDALEEYRTNPEMLRATGIANQIADNPDPVDWQLVRNKTTAENNNQLEALTQQLTSSLGNRGLSAATGAGMQSEVNRSSARDLSSRLGDLRIQEGQSMRQGQQQAIDALSGVSAQHMGGVNQMSQGLAQLIATGDTKPFNPAQQATDLRSGMSAVDASEEQADELKKEQQKQQAIAAASMIAMLLI